MQQVSDTLPAPAPEPPPALTDRYAPLGFIGSGGLGQVLRVYDRRLEAPVALKLLHAHLAADADWLRRFDAEARLLASLAHPGIPPVHDLDRLADGRPFYTMALVRGEPWAQASVRLGLRRRVALLRDVAATVGWAHRQQVVHRDLSPHNVLIEGDARALVIDWGLARRLGEEEAPVLLSERAGTPGFAAPELHLGLATARSDVWALGGLLDEDDADLRALREACRQHDPALRPPDGDAVADALDAWLDGQARRERAQREVARARALQEQAAEAEARAALRGAPGLSQEEVWRQEDEAAEAALDAARRHAEAEQALHIALHEDEGCEEAHAALTSAWRSRLLAADAAGDRRAVAQLETQLRGWRGGRYAALAEATGQLRLHTAPPADRIVVQRFVEVARQLRAVEVATTEGPTLDLRVPAGSLRLVIERDGQQTLLPLRLGRGDAWTFRGPDGGEVPVPLAPPGLAPEDRYVPGGWFHPAPDPGAADVMDPSPVWLAPFILRRHPVTVAEWLEFLDDRARGAGAEAALAYAPRELSSSDQPRAVVRWRGDRFEVGGDEWATAWAPDWPVVLIDRHDALAFAAWRAAREGLPWRLPQEAEWELAARGADSRIYAWGDHLLPGHACTAASGAPGRASIHAFPQDEGPFGLRGATGNVRDWCADVWTAPDRPMPAEPLFVVRGGAWSSAATMCRLAMRFAARPTDRLTMVGLRLARSVGPAGQG